MYHNKSIIVAVSMANIVSKDWAAAVDIIRQMSLVRKKAIPSRFRVRSSSMVVSAAFLS